MNPEISSMHVFYLDFETIPKGRPRLGRGRIYTPKRTSDFEKLVRLELRRQFKDEIITSPVHLNARFYFKKSKSCKSKHMTKRIDIDNCLKSIADSMNGVVLKDDSLIVSIDAMKAYDNHGRTELTLYVFEE